MTQRLTAADLNRIQGTQRLTAAELNKIHLKGKRTDREGPHHKAILAYARLALPTRSIIHHSPNENNMAGDSTARMIAITRAKSLGMQPGWPDLEIMLDGRGYFLEIKPPGEASLSTDQIKTHSRLRRAGCKVQMVTSVDGARRAFEEWGLI